MTRIYGNIGFTGLWNGLPVRIVMIGTLTAFQWLMYVFPYRYVDIYTDNNAATIHLRCTSDCLQRVVIR